MTPRLQLVLLFLVALPVGLRAGRVIDRVVATVDSRVITESEWEDTVRMECLLEGRPIEQLIPEDRRAALERLMDQVLLEEQRRSSGFEQAPGEEVAGRVRALRERFPEAKEDAGWRARLARYGLTEAVVAERLARQLDLERFIDQSFRPRVYVDPASIETYYREQLVAQLRQKNAVVPPLAEMRDQIERLLTEQRVNELLNSWLQMLRAQSRIEVR